MTRIKHFAVSIVVLFCVNSVVFAQSEYDARAGNALNGGMPFELRDAYEAAKDSLNPMLKCFAEAMLADWFNHPREACAAIDTLVNNYQEEIGIGNVLGMLYVRATNMGRLGQYDEAAQMLYGVLQSVAPHLGDSALAPYYEKADEYRELAKIGDINAIVIPEQGARIPFRIDTIGQRRNKVETIIIEATINGKRQDVVFDTGAGVNVASEKAAEKLSLRTLDAKSRAEGFGVQHGRKAVADEIKMGDITLRNVPFLVMDISSGVDSIDNMYLNHLDITMGVEFMHAAKETQIDFKKKELFVPHTPSAIGHDEKQNLAGGSNGTYCALADVNGTAAHVGLDTGAGQSVIGSRYFAMHKDSIEARCEADTLRQAGAGGVRIEKAYKLKEFTVAVGGGTYTFPEISVATEAGDPLNDRLANLGIDYFRQFDKVIFNTKDMFVRMISDRTSGSTQFISYQDADLSRRANR